MTTPRHTPAPWTAERETNQHWTISAPDGDPTLKHQSWHGMIDVWGCDDFPHDGSQVAEANAHLVAAAPELYEALQDALELYGEQEMHYPDYDRYVAVLKKARGETP